MFLFFPLCLCTQQFVQDRIYTIFSDHYDKTLEECQYEYLLYENTFIENTMKRICHIQIKPGYNIEKICKALVNNTLCLSAGCDINHVTNAELVKILTTKRKYIHLFIYYDELEDNDYFYVINLISKYAFKECKDILDDNNNFRKCTYDQSYESIKNGTTECEVNNDTKNKMMVVQNSKLPCHDKKIKNDKLKPQFSREISSDDNEADENIIETSNKSKNSLNDNSYLESKYQSNSRKVSFDSNTINSCENINTKDIIIDKPTSCNRACCKYYHRQDSYRSNSSTFTGDKSAPYTDSYNESLSSIRERICLREYDFLENNIISKDVDALFDPKCIRENDTQKNYITLNELFLNNSSDKAKFCIINCVKKRKFADKNDIIKKVPKLVCKKRIVDKRANKMNHSEKLDIIEEIIYNDYATNNHYVLQNKICSLICKSNEDFELQNTRYTISYSITDKKLPEFIRKRYRLAVITISDNISLNSSSFYFIVNKKGELKYALCKNDKVLCNLNVLLRNIRFLLANHPIVDNQSIDYTFFESRDYICIRPIAENTLSLDAFVLERNMLSKCGYKIKTYTFTLDHDTPRNKYMQLNRLMKITLPNQNKKDDPILDFYCHNDHNLGQVRCKKKICDDDFNSENGYIYIVDILDDTRLIQQYQIFYLAHSTEQELHIYQYKKLINH